MRLSENLVKNIEELRKELSSIESCPIEYSVAVEGLIFSSNLEWILIKRGKGCRDEIGKLEGIGGRFENDNTFEDALQREIQEEVGKNAEIVILSFFEIRKDTVWDIKSSKEKNWIIIFFVCKYKSGELKIMEPAKNDGFFFKNLSDIDVKELSSSASSAYQSIIKRQSEIINLLKT
jgi:ADP-ribose pyrophosphatase YjhB (NUDIX family)